MSEPLVSDALWAVIEPLLPPEPPKPRGGRPRVPDRAALTGILFVLRSGIPWEMLPQEMGCGSGMTCWRRLRDWQQAGVWDKLQRVLLDRLGRRNAIDFRRAALDSASVAAKRGAPRQVQTRRIAASRARSGTSSPMRKASCQRAVNTPCLWAPKIPWLAPRPEV
jgi:transposase